MADISKCGNPQGCKKKETCFRHTAVSSSWQSFSDFYESDKECEYYIETRSKSQARRLDIQTRDDFATTNLQQHHETESGVCETCQIDPVAVCKHGFCASCSCPSFCWLD